MSSDPRLDKDFEQESDLHDHDNEDHEEVETQSASSPGDEKERERGRQLEAIDSPRHSFEYARSREPSRPLSLHRTASTHESLYNTVSILRSRNVGQTRSFSHPLAKKKTSADCLVEFDGKDDPYRPINWPFRKKVVTTTLYGLTTFGITFASSVFSSGLGQISNDFSVGHEVATLGISLMLFGFGLGPLIWAPLSELYGRKAAVLTPYFISAIFSFATGAAKDIQTVMLCRFFAGFFGSAPITNTGGVLGDIWSAQQRAPAIVGYAIAVTAGPTLGPVIGGALVSSYLRWRWTEYLTGIIMMTVLILDIVLLDESFPPVLLQYKAQRLRHESGNWALHASHEEWDVSLRELGRKYLLRPFQILVNPICFLVAIYASFVYGILYANLSSFPIAYQEVRGWGPVVGALPFLAITVGIFIGAVANILNNKYYFRAVEKNGGRPVPEARLPPMMIGGIVFAAGLFIFGWTSSPSVNYWPGLVGIALTGLGFFTIFQAALNYLIDTFTRYGASAVAANTFLRSMFAGVFPLFVTPM